MSEELADLQEYEKGNIANTKQFQQGQQTLSNIDCVSNECHDSLMKSSEEAVDSRLAIYRKLKQHELALKMLLDEVNNLEKAEEYVISVYESEQAEQKKVSKSNNLNVGEESIDDIELKTSGNNKKEKQQELEEQTSKTKTDNDVVRTLFELLLQRENNVPRVDEAIRVLTHLQQSLPVTYKWSKIFKLFPDDISFNKVSSILQRIIVNQRATINEKQLQQTLLQSQHVVEFSKLCNEHSRNVTIQNTNCAVCNKQIRVGSVFVVYPNNVIVHELCASNYHICPKTNYNFSTSPLALLHSH